MGETARETVEPKPGEIQQEIGHLNEVVDQLTAHMDELCTRLIPVLASQQPAEVPSEKAKLINESEIGTAIAEIKCKTQYIRNRVQDLIKRLRI